MSEQNYDEWKVLDRIIAAVSACKHLLQGSSALGADGRITLQLSDFEQSCGFTKSISEKLYKERSVNLNRMDVCQWRFNLQFIFHDEKKDFASRSITFLLNNPPPSLHRFFKDELPLVNGNHKEHDTFVRNYLQLPDGGDDEVASAITIKIADPIMADEKPKVVAFVTKERLNESSLDKRVKNLALFILLDQYPDEWSAMFEPAYTLLCSLLANAITPFRKIFPPSWTQQVFRLENIISPGSLQGLIFGIDPIPKDLIFARAATGHAFAFDERLENFIKDQTSSSTSGLRDVYGLNKTIDFNNAATLEDQLTKAHGIGIVNFIRTIVEYKECRDDRGYNTPVTGSNNSFGGAWAAYNVAWLTLLRGLWEKTGEGCNNRVLIFENEGYPFEGYCGAKVADLLPKTEVPRCSHPSHIERFPPLMKIAENVTVEKDAEHCLAEPNCAYLIYDRSLWPWKLRQITINKKGNESILAFTNFLDQRGAKDLYSCPCSKCVLKKKLVAELAHFFAQHSV